MPIYEYECAACRERFEALVYGSQRAACPSCGSLDLEKQFSAFAVVQRSAAVPPGCPMPQGGG